MLLDHIGAVYDCISAPYLCPTLTYPWHTLQGMESMEPINRGMSHGLGEELGSSTKLHEA